MKVSVRVVFEVLVALGIVCSNCIAAPRTRQTNGSRNGNSQLHGHGNNGRHGGNNNNGGHSGNNGRHNGRNSGSVQLPVVQLPVSNIRPANSESLGTEPLVPPPSDTQNSARATMTSWEDWHKVWEASNKNCGYPGTRPVLRDARLRVATLPGEQHTYAQLGNYPWMASLQVMDPFNNEPTHWCGGALISDQWLVTAAHCLFSVHPFVWGEKHWTVVLGAVNIRERDASEQKYKVNRIMVHPGFNKEMIFGPRKVVGTPSDHDIALVKLADPVDVSGPWIRPACLPKPNELPEVGTPCVVTGWGWSAELNRTSDVLKQGQVPTMNYDMCKAQDGYNHWLTPNMLCAGLWDGGVDACKYDSGGPLQCPNGEQWILTGVVSWGDKNEPGCAKPLRPGVYTRVDTHITWIQETIYADDVGLPLITWDKIIPTPAYFAEH